MGTRYHVTGAGAGGPTCAHLDQATDIEPSTTEGCEDCLRDGTRWVHLRECLSCGHVGCCDSSPRRHASAHYQGTQHPLIRSMEAGEDWGWCYPDQIVLAPVR